MATIGLKALEPVKTLSGNSPQVLSYPEAATQTFKKGDIVQFSAAGYITSANAVTDPLQIVGVAAEDGHNGTSAGDYETKVWIANDDTVFLGNIKTSSTTALTQVGKRYGLVYETNRWGVDVTDTGLTTARVIVHQLDRRDAVGDTNGRVHFMFMDKFAALASTS